MAHVIWLPRPFNRLFRRLINILLGQPKQLIDRALVMLKVSAPIRVEQPSIHHLRPPNALAFLDLPDASGVPLVTWLVADGPVGFFTADHTQSGGQHVFLVDGEGIDVNGLVGEVGNAGLILVGGSGDGEAEKGGNGATNLWQR